MSQAAILDDASVGKVDNSPRNDRTDERKRWPYNGSAIWYYPNLMYPEPKISIYQPQKTLPGSDLSRQIIKKQFYVGLT